MRNFSEKPANGSYITDAPWGVGIKAIHIKSGVTSIGNDTFDGCASLESITIPDSVTSIGFLAFGNCSSLAMVTIPESVTSIRTSAFICCTSLESIAIPEGVTSIDAYVFYKCSSLASITIPDSVTSISDWAFGNCSSLETITIPDSVTGIGNYTFRGCTGLVSIALPDNVTWIGEDAFQNCTGLTSITLPDSVTSIGNYAFRGCTRLASIVIPDSVTSIGYSYGMFSGCTGLATVKLPDSVKSIDQEMLYGCTSLTSIMIPKGVTNIRNKAFFKCTNLASITIPDSVTSIGEMAFASCDSLSRVVFLGGEDDPLTISSNPFSDQKPVIYCYMFSPADTWFSQNGWTPIYLDNIDIDTIRTVTLPQDFCLACGDSRRISAGVFPDTGNPLPTTWQSSAPSVASVADGVVTAHAPGEAVITATVGDVSDSVTVQTYIAATGFALNESELWVLARNQVPLSVASWEPEGATGEITWRSSDTDLATVDASGLVATIKPGDVTITATSERGISRECLIHLCYPVTAVAFDPETVVLKDGQTQQVTASVTARTQNFVNKLVSFESSNADAATVDAAGLVTARGLGTATITATAASGKSASCKVVVTNRASVLTLPANLTAIEAEAFMGDTAIEAVIVPEGCGAIGAKAFAGCVNLVYVKVPAGTTIAADAFEGCGNVTVERVE